MNDRPNPGWWSRNWKWFVPTGCLTVILLAGLLLFGLVGLGIKGVSGLMNSSEPVRHAIALAQAHPDARAALGTPLQAGMMISGSLHTNNSSGSADLTIPVTGPNGGGKLYIKGEREAERWTYSLIELAIDGSGQRIDLLKAAPVQPNGEPSVPADKAPAEDMPSESTPSESTPEQPAETPSQDEQESETAAEHTARAA